MFISLPAPRIPTMTGAPVKRRPPLTPPSVAPPSVSVSESTTLPGSRDRCKSPCSRASALLAKVAIVNSTPSTVPSSPRLCGASSPESANSTPTATPPDDCGQFPFASTKQLPASPEGGYVSFPMFEAFGDYAQDQDDGSVSPTHR
ncbi:hypothetical protein BZA77DRAFT_252271 [Pyronema omphalodes]|nr:hypothetical protein BZA77DRAFT_252271 [Pyronema omphalodes]